MTGNSPRSARHAYRLPLHRFQDFLEEAIHGVVARPPLGLRARRVSVDDVVDQLARGGLAALQEP